MFLLNEIIVNLHPSNINHYQSLGYQIPKYTDRRGQLKVKKGTKIKVKVNDLPEKSNIKILCKCDNADCYSKPKMVIYGRIPKNRKYLCNKCSKNTREWKEKRSKLVSGKNNPFYNIRKFGPNNPNYNPNLTNRERYLSTNRNLNPKYYSALKNSKERDNYSCIICGSKKSIESHHLLNCKNYPEYMCDPNNIVTLCHGHHTAKNGKSIHNIYGRYPTKEHWEEFVISFQTNKN